MQKYTVEYQLHAKEQNTRTVEVEMDRVPDLNNQEELNAAYQIVSDAIREPITRFEIVSIT
ncbi:hypothetical protein [Exiguobacterium sp. s129]|uniref:hypothetical protein n=1 Tax=Exiguobacterium sp. s129 TaxID=2751264 RepID=UPI0020373991|nr:hypothetical protein [Exiguobacterium sp. s129]